MWFFFVALPMLCWGKWSYLCPDWSTVDQLLWSTGLLFQASAGWKSTAILAVSDDFKCKATKLWQFRGNDLLPLP